MLEQEQLAVIRRAGSQRIMEGDSLKIVGFEIVIRVADPAVAEKRVREFMLEIGADSSMTIDQIDDDNVFQPKGFLRRMLEQLRNIFEIS